MTTGQFLRRAMAAAIAFTVACGDSTAPNTIELTDDQVDDMMEAFSALGSTPEGTSASNILALIVTVDETIGCPNGGTFSEEGNWNFNEQANSISIDVTQDFAACKATSSSGRLWTFDGNPNLHSTFSMTSNPTTNAFSMTGSQTGGLMVASDLGSGVCNWNVTYTMNGTPVPGTEDEFNITGSVTGTVCGRSINVDLSIQP